MYRNSIENLPHNLSNKTTANKMMMGTSNHLINHLTKCNYMEYIKKIERALKPPLKGTSRALTFKGTSECEKILCLSFQTWLIPNIATDTKIALNYGLYSRLTSWLIRLISLIKG